MKREDVFIVIVAIVLCFTSVVFAADKIVKCKTCKKEIGAELTRNSVVQRDVSKPVTFNDIGCALIYREKQCSSRQNVFDTATRVFDFNDGQEVEITIASYVRSEVVKSPEGHNFVAFKDEVSAKAFLQENGGELFTYDDVQMLDFPE